MNNRTICAGLLALTLLGGSIVAPVAANAQRYEDESHHRQQKKNEWRNIAIGAGALSVLGLLKHDNTLTFAGAAGALYSANRYEQDRRSQARIDRARAAYFSQPYFDRDGDHFTRKTVWRNGHKYYRFVRE